METLNGTSEGTRAAGAARRFIVLTSPRSGSWALMHTLIACGALGPGLGGDPRSYECLQPTWLEPLARGLGISLATLRQHGPGLLLRRCLDAQLAAGARHAAVKLFPHQFLFSARRLDCPAPAEALLANLLVRRDLDIVTLLRRDRVSRVASTLVALDSGDWRRGLAAQTARLQVDRRLLRRARHWAGIHARNDAVQAMLPATVRLHFEALCAGGFGDPALSAYLDRALPAGAPSPVSDARPRLSDAASFTTVVEDAYARIDADFASSNLGLALRLALDSLPPARPHTS